MTKQNLLSLFSLFAGFLLVSSCLSVGDEPRLGNRFGDSSQFEEGMVLTPQMLEREIDWSIPEANREFAVERLGDLAEETRERLLAMSGEEVDVRLQLGDLYELWIALERYQVRHGQLPEGGVRLGEVVMEELGRQGLEGAVHPTMLVWQSRFFQVVDHLQNRPAQVRVRLVDEEGEPLEGVNLQVVRSIPRMLSIENRRVVRDHTVDGEFTLRMRNENSVLFRARKEGYYDARETIQPPRRSNLEAFYEQAWADVVLGRQTVIDSEEPELLNVVLELRKKGELVQLFWFRGVLEIRADGSGRIMRLYPPGGRRPGRTVIMERQGIVYEVDDVLQHIQESEDPRELALMVAFEDGEILEKTSKRIGQRERHFPENLVFLSSDEGGGFQLSPEQNNRLMVEAPEDGYEQRLEVSFSDLGEESVWYYFKAGGHYGKMSLGPPNLTLTVDEEGFSWVRYQVTFSLNPTAGDRNLEHGL